MPEKMQRNWILFIVGGSFKMNNHHGKLFVKQNKTKKQLNVPRIANLGIYPRK